MSSPGGQADRPKLAGFPRLRFQSERKERVSEEQGPLLWSDLLVSAFLGAGTGCALFSFTLESSPTLVARAEWGAACDVGEGALGLSFSV